MNVRAIEGAEPIWVGLLDLDDDMPAVGISGPVGSHHSQARILIRIHLAPIGYIQIPIRPQETLTARAQAEAQQTLAEPLRLHAESDTSGPGDPQLPEGSEVILSCPRRFPAHTGTGMTVVICTRDRTRQLSECLTALLRSTYSPLEVLVVDNAPSQDATRRTVAALAKKDHRVRYTCEPRPGLSRARNRGLSEARFDLVAFTDDDTFADPGWPSALVAGFAGDPEAVCITGPVIPRSLETGCQVYFEARYSGVRLFQPRRYDLVKYRYPSRLYPFRAGIFGTGANFAVRRGAVTDVGGFDPLLGTGGPGRGGEDLDMFLRLVLAGGRILYLPSALLWHQHRAEIDALGEQIYSYGHGLGAYLAKHLHNQDLRSALVAHGLQQLGTTLRQIRNASTVSHLGPTGRRLALAEARGLIVGAFRYRYAARTVGKESAGAG